jgi:hypothetical protein
VSIRDVTQLIIQVRDLVAAGWLREARHLLPAEHPYPVGPQLASVIGMAGQLLHPGQRDLRRG